MTNILALPVAEVEITTGNNEDWVDSIKFVVDPGDGTPVENMDQLDLTGINFDMEVRRVATDSEVVFAASTKTGSLSIGDHPDTGFLVIQIPLAEMQNHAAGAYVADIVGHDDYFQRVCVQINLTIVEGVTKQPVQKRIVVEYP
jgi:hypothetical protein